MASPHDQDATDAGLPGKGGPALRPDRCWRSLYVVSRVMAIGGGLVCVALAVMLVVTIFSRKVFLWQVTGDYELVQMFGAVAGSLFFPWCLLVGGNIIVDLFTAGAPERFNRALDRLSSLLLAAIALLIAWRTGVQALQSESSGAISPMLSWPLWVFQAMMIPGFLATAAVGIYLAMSSRGIEYRRTLPDGSDTD